MTFNSHKPFQKRNSTAKYLLMFTLGLFSVLIFTNAINVVTGIENATQYIKEIVLTNDGTAKGTSGVIIDGNTSGGRIGSELYCTLDFSKCISIKGLVQTGDLTGYLTGKDIVGFLTGKALVDFKAAEIDPPFITLSGRISTISGALALYAKLADLGTLATKSELSSYALVSSLASLATKSELSSYALVSSLASLATKGELSSYALVSSLASLATRSELSSYALVSSLASLATKSELSSYALTGDLTSLATKSELSNYATTGQTALIDGNTTKAFTTLNTIIDNYNNGAISLSQLFSGVNNISKD